MVGPVGDELLADVAESRAGAVRGRGVGVSVLLPCVATRGRLGRRGIWLLFVDHFHDLIFYDY